MISYENQRVAVFIDTQNMYYSARNLFGQKVNFENIIKEATDDRKIISSTAYVVATKGGEETPFFDALKAAGIYIKEKQLMEYLSGVKKADWDVGIAVDVIAMLDMVDAVVLISGDGDFTHLARYVQNHGRRFEVMSFRETTSINLVEVVDKYTNLSEDKSKYLLGRARRPAVHMTRGGEALSEKDQEAAVAKAALETKTPKAPARKTTRKSSTRKSTRKTHTKKPATKKTTKKAGEESSRSRRLSF